MMYLRDSENNEIKTGDKVRTIISIKTGEQKTSKYKIPLYDKKEFVGEVRFGVFKDLQLGEIITWYLDISETNSYNTSFYAGLGRTLSDRKRNESVAVTENLSRVLSKALAAQCTLIK